MTRETKIGLLVGLGFIVVFAVLLSHTGNVPPPGETISPSMVQNPGANKPVLNGEIRKEIGQPEPIPTVDVPRALDSSPEAEPVRAHIEERVVISLDELPAPSLLEPQSRMEVVSADQRRDDLLVAPPEAVLTMRAAPKPIVEDPQPSLPHTPPTRTSTPDGAADVPANPGGNKVAPAQGPPKEYVVQGRDSLVKIAQKHYRSADPRLVQFLVKSNEGRIKNADTIFEGQKLLIPDLPKEMFEQVPEFNVAAGRGVSMEEFMNSQGRSAPRPANAEPAPQSPVNNAGKPTTPDAKKTGTSDSRSNSGSTQAGSATEDKKAAVKPAEDSAPRLSLSGLVPVRPTPLATGGNSNAPTADKKDTRPADKNAKPDPKAKADQPKGDQLYRWYEVKANDTLGAIARKELGSSQHWQEIRKLNGGIDPQKMKPGERIKLPLKPVSGSSKSGRPSA